MVAYREKGRMRKETVLRKTPSKNSRPRSENFTPGKSPETRMTKWKRSDYLRYDFISEKVLRALCELCFGYKDNLVQ